MNYFMTSILKPQTLPKLDFSEGVPEDCNNAGGRADAADQRKAESEQLVEDLEIRYLGNHDPNIHYALLTDLADSAGPAERTRPAGSNSRIRLIEELNEKYAHRDIGHFFLFHRHRVYNPREKAWMGWERKRGKLLDLNQLLRERIDSFPVKAGDLSACSSTFGL